MAEVSAAALSGVTSALAVETLARTGRLRFRANGTSMLPALRPGDELEIVAPASDLELGDIVLWRRSGRLFVHRVVAIDADHVRTQGDALLHADPLVPAAEVLGRLASYERRGRRHSAPRRRAWDRCWGWIMRRSDIASRMFLRWHFFTRRLRA